MSDINYKYRLNSRVKLEEINKDHISIIKRIKSRIIQKNAEKIIDQSNIIREKDSNVKVSLVCTKNICSKSVALLNENNIDIIFRD